MWQKYEDIDNECRWKFTPRPKFEPLPGDLLKELIEELKPMAESFFKVKLALERTRGGIRRYVSGSFMPDHIDGYVQVEDVSLIGGLLHVGRSDDVFPPWPLQIKDQQGKTHNVFFEPGEVLFYESTK